MGQGFGHLVQAIQQRRIPAHSRSAVWGGLGDRAKELMARRWRYEVKELGVRHRPQQTILAVPCNQEHS